MYEVNNTLGKGGTQENNGIIDGGETVQRQF